VTNDKKGGCKKTINWSKRDVGAEKETRNNTGERVGDHLRNANQ